MDQTSFNTIWSDWEKKSMIVPAADGEHYRNLMPWGGTAPKSHQSAKQKLKDRLIKDHPGTWKKFKRDSNEDLR